VAYFIYILIYPLIFIFSRLPFWLLYFFSDILSFIIYRVIGYRKKIVRYNLALVFPEKSESERLQIEKAFYKHFTDLFIEMIKAFNMPAEQIHKRFQFKNPELLNQISETGQHIVLVGNHYGNWEWLLALASVTKAEPIATYLKVNNPYFEKFLVKNRGRFGTRLIETKQLRHKLKDYKKNNQRFILGLLADQSPERHRAKYWRSFLGQPHLPVFTGPEELAKEYNAAYVFMKINKIKRGYYTVDFELLTDTPNQIPDYQITDKYLDLIEQQIRQKPDYYLWTHNRFKHQGKKPNKKA
jgi:KDO2-lipid IV(A) lauroyltransferase